MRRDVEVQLEFLPTEMGGRRTAARTGYRPQLFYDDQDFDAMNEYPDVLEASPGDRVRAYLCLLHPELHDGRLPPGKEILVREGSRIVARGHVVRILELSDAAARHRLEELLESYYLALCVGRDADPQRRGLYDQLLAEAARARHTARSGATIGDLRQQVLAAVQPLDPALPDACSVGVAEALGRLLAVVRENGGEGSDGAG
jgi:hypothetical protein